MSDAAANTSRVSAAVQAKFDELLRTRFAAEPQSAFRLAAADFAALPALAGGSDAALFALAHAVKHFAVTPISNFHVGCAVLASDGAVYLGVNIEFARQPLDAAIHAEQCALATAAAHGATLLVTLAASASPCGHCRQFCQELHGARALRVLLDASLAAHSLDAILPFGFGPSDLGNDDNVLLAHATHRIRAVDGVVWQQPIASGLDAADAERLEQAAHGAYERAYAPYTASLASAALLYDAAGATGVVSGFYIESCAYNPSLDPLRAALCELVQRGVAFDCVRAAWFCEAPNARVRHSSQAAALLRDLAPSARIGVQQIREHVFVPSEVLSPVKRRKVLDKLGHAPGDVAAAANDTATTTANVAVTPAHVG